MRADFPDRLRSLRRDKGISQEILGSALTVDKSTISLYESGKRKPDYEIIEKLADYFNTTTDYLLGRSDDPTPPDADEPSDRELEELMKKGGLMFDGVPLDDEDKQDILDVMRIAWKTIQRRKPK